jgi:NAD+ synthase
MESPEKVAEYISQWLTDYVEKSNMKGFVVGISGGIDSALTSTLCAMTGKAVLCLEMPIKQGEDQLKLSSEHIDWLKQNFSNVRSIRLTLDSVFESFCVLLPDPQDPKAHELSLANTRARLRMTSLYYFAALEGYLVAGTGNKVEDFGVGFYTKYGDGGVDLSPIADLTKTQVFNLANHLNIIDVIQNAAPTDGLWGDDRTDEDQLGATYPELEWAMEAHENNTPHNQFNPRQKEVFQIFKKHFNQNQHKMQPIPVCEIPTEIS